jgi:hypothetical protein
MIVLLDTSVVIDALNARAQIRSFLQDQLRGCPNSNSSHYRKL